MGTTREDIRSWLERAKAKGATHMIVVCDTYDYEDYPVEVMPGQDARKVYNDHNGPNMTRAMEIYNLSMDIEKQLLEHRAHNF
jgi:hypothetical protein